MITNAFRVSARRGLMLAGILALGTCAALAQTSEATSAPGPGPGGRRGPNTEHEVQMLTQVLSLSADQQTQVRAALTEQRQKMEALRSAPRAAASTEATDSAAAPTGRRAQMEALRAETDTKITAVLNDEHKTKYAALQAERKARMQERGGDRGGPPPPPPQD